MRDDFGDADFTQAGDVGTAAEFDGETVFAHADDAHHVAVFFAEKCHRAFFLRVVTAHLFDGHRGVAQDLRIHHGFDAGDFVSTERFVVREVEAGAAFVHQRAFLLYVGAEGAAQGFMQQVGGGMVPLDGGTAVHVDLGFCRFAAGHAAFDNVAEMQEGIALFLRVCDGKDAVCGADGAGVADLSAGFAVERGAVKDDNAVFAAEQAVDRCAVGEDLHDLRGAVVVFVTFKGGFTTDIKFLRGVEFASGFGALALRRHFPLKAVAVEFDAEFARHVGGEVVGEAVGVIEFEDDFAGDDQLAVCEVFVQILFQRGDVGGGFRIAEFGFVAQHIFHINSFRLALRGTQQDLFAVRRLQGADVEGFAISGVQFDGFLRSVQRQ